MPPSARSRPTLARTRGRRFPRGSVRLRFVHFRLYGFTFSRFGLRARLSNFTHPLNPAVGQNLGLQTLEQRRMLLEIRPGVVAPLPDPLAVHGETRNPLLRH